MASAEASIHIDRPAADVFAFVGDPVNNPRWRKNVARMTWEDAGPMRVGRRGAQVQHVLGRDWTVTAEVVEWDPPRRATWRAVQGPVIARSWVRVEPDGEGCNVTAGADGGFAGPIGAILTRLAAPRMLAQAEVDLRTLKAHLESGDR
jgi:uncharacterized membrane protein